MTSPAYLGLDIAKRKFDAALLHQPGRCAHHQFPNNQDGFAQLALWLQRHATGPLYACMEATGTYGDAVALFLHQQGHRVSVVNPARIKAFGQSELSRTKTDKADAALIARFAQSAMAKLRTWAPLPPEHRQLQALVRRLEAVQRMRQQERNRLDLESTDSLVAESLRQHLAYLDDHIRQLQQQLRAHVRAHRCLQKNSELLQSIPGIGQTTAFAVLAEIPDLAQWPSARQAAAYAGLTPRHRESGSSVRGRPRLSKIGNPRLRRALYLPAVVAMRANPILRAFASRLLAAGKPKMAVVGAVMRKLLHQAYGVLKHATPFNPNLEVAP
jgi:transposase